MRALLVYSVIKPYEDEMQYTLKVRTQFFWYTTNPGPTVSCTLTNLKLSDCHLHLHVVRYISAKHESFDACKPLLKMPFYFIEGQLSSGSIFIETVSGCKKD